MSFLLLIIQRYGHVALFVLCEIIAFTLILNFNQKQKEIFLHSSSLFSGSVLKKTAQLGDYISLQQSNDDLLKENARLLEEIISMPRPKVPEQDTSKLNFDVIPARIIKNSILSIRNHLTIDKGMNDGVESSYGVATSDGVVGVVKNVNDEFATVLSLLNVDMRLSASIGDADFFGTITWDGQSYELLKLTGIPLHAPVTIGKVVYTNGYSTIFPRGLKVGQITSFSISKNGAFYDIYVTPTVDFAQLGHVYVLKGNFIEEISTLESDE